MKSSRSTSSNSNQSNSNQSNSNHSSSDDSSSRELKLQVKMVAGELENVLGELKTVVGDLRMLVTQIDEVTSKIDKEYGLDAETLDKAKRRLSTSVLETRPSKKNIYRLSGSQSFDIVQPGCHREYMSAAEIRDLSPSVSSRHSSTAYRRRMQWLLNPQTGYASNEVDDNRGPRVKTRTKSFSKPELGSKQCFEKVVRLEKSAEEIRHSRKDHNIENVCGQNNCKGSKHGTQCSSKSRNIGQFDYIPRASELMAMRMLKSNSSVDKPLHTAPNGIVQVKSQKPKKRHHFHCKKSSKTSPTIEYSGVYEKELDSLLECDEMQNHDSFDETRSNISVTEVLDNANKDYSAQYDRDVNTWTTYTMVHLGAHGYSDDQLSETTETTSDILNDNVTATTTANFDSYGITFT